MYSWEKCLYRIYSPRQEHTLSHLHNSTVCFYKSTFLQLHSWEKMSGDCFKFTSFQWKPRNSPYTFLAMAIKSLNSLTWNKFLFKTHSPKEKLSLYSQNMILSSHRGQVGKNQWTEIRIWGDCQLESLLRSDFSSIYPNTISVQIKDFRKNLLLLRTLNIHVHSAKHMSIQFTLSHLNEMVFYICFAFSLPDWQRISESSLKSSTSAQALSSNNQTEQVAATSFTPFSPGKCAYLVYRVRLKTILL